MGNVKREDPEPSEAGLESFLAPLESLQKLLDEYNNQGVIIGGLAASLLGAPRYTADIDAVFLMHSDEIPGFLDVAAKYGIGPRMENVEDFARKNRILLLRHIKSGIDIDLSMGMLPFEYEMVERSQLIEAGSILLRLPSPEDLIIMKAIAHRPKDLADIQAIAENNPDLDKSRIQFWVQQFGEALDLPDLWKDIQKHL